ncbi:MAG: hypothetical protein ACR5KX_03350 [Wolbachia sp.]
MDASVNYLDDKKGGAWMTEGGSAGMTPLLTGNLICPITIGISYRFFYR